MQTLQGTVADLEWDKDTGNLKLTAVCHLPAGTPLTSALAALGADPDHLLMTHGPGCLARAQKAHQGNGQREGQGCSLLPWQSPDAASFQLCVEPPEEDEAKERKMEVLAASALGTSHALTAASSQVCLSYMLFAACCAALVHSCSCAAWFTPLPYAARTVA